MIIFSSVLNRGTERNQKLPWMVPSLSSTYSGKLINDHKNYKSNQVLTCFYVTIFIKTEKTAPTNMFFTSSSSRYSGKLIMMVLNYKSRHLLSSLALVCRGSSAVVCCAEAGSMHEDVRGGHARPACSPRGCRHQHNGYMITIVLIIYQIEARADLFCPSTHR